MRRSLTPWIVLAVFGLLGGCAYRRRGAQKRAVDQFTRESGSHRLPRTQPVCGLTAM